MGTQYTGIQKCGGHKQAEPEGSSFTHEIGGLRLKERWSWASTTSKTDPSAS